jgi:hypothetical protein
MPSRFAKKTHAGKCPIIFSLKISAFRVGIPLYQRPKAAPCSQPWAESFHPVGIGETNDRAPDLAWSSAQNSEEPRRPSQNATLGSRPKSLNIGKIYSRGGAEGAEKEIISMFSLRALPLGANHPGGLAAAGHLSRIARLEPSFRIPGLVPSPCVPPAAAIRKAGQKPVVGRRLLQNSIENA